MTAFATALDALFADAHLARDVVYTAEGGAPSLVRAILRRPDDVTGFGEARIWSETTRLDLRLAEVANPRPGDRIEIDGEAFLIQGEPVRDRERLVWTVDLRPAMKLKLDITPDLVAAMAAEVKAGEKAVTAAMREAGTGLKTAWRGQITGAGLGRRLANSIRSQTYPKAGESLNAAALVWSKAPVIVGAHDTGPLIRSKNGFWLAIPTEAAGRGLRGAKLTPGEWERRRGLRLRFVYRRRGPSLLVAEGRLNTERSGGGVALEDRPRARSPRRSSCWSRRSSCRSGWIWTATPSGRTTACRG
jgi:hypothetical protein